MSWLTDIVSKTASNTSSSVDESGNQKKHKTTMFISIDQTRINFLEIDTFVSPNKIVSWEEVALGPVENLEEGEPVRDIFGSLLKVLTNKREKIDNKEEVNVSLPSDGVFFKNVEVPSMQEADTQKMILAEIKKTLPVDFSQVLFAQNDLGSRHEEKKSFFCVGIQKMLFENFKNLFSKFSVNPYFEIEVFSLARIVPRDKENRLILQIGKSSTSLIFLNGQIIQDVKKLEMGENDINKEIVLDLGLKFSEIEILKKSLSKLEDAGRVGYKILEQYVKKLNAKIAKSISLNILEYEKKQDQEIKDLIISGVYPSTKIKKAIIDEFDAELKVDFINEENLGNFEAESFDIQELKRYAQCFGLALRNK